MLRYPTVSSSQIAFVYANNIWVVSREGGVASPLAAPPGASSLPRFSPDGKTIAFVGNYDGNRDIYTVPVAGGVPFRVTHHPGAESLSGWASADTLLFFTAGAVNMARQTQMFTVSAHGGLPTKVPVPYGAFGSYDATGEWLAYTPHSIDNRTWKRYRGGMATDVWLLNMRDHTSKRLTDWEGTDTLPMWGFGPAAKTVYYLSDEGEQHRLNIWSCEIESGKRTQLTSFADDDVRWPSIGPGAAAGGRGEIVFQLGSRLMLLNLDAGTSAPVEVVIPGARPKIKPKSVDASETITSWSLAPSGKRVLMVGRGDIWSLPAKEGVTRNLSHSPAVFERDAAWSPDGRWIAYFSDQSGEYELWVRPSDARRAENEKKDGKGDDSDAKAVETVPVAGRAIAPARLTTLGPGFRYNPAWSPDSMRIAFTDRAGRILVASLAWEGDSASAVVRTIDKDPQGEPTLSWANDSKHIAYTRGDEDNEHGCVWIATLGEANAEPIRTRVTHPMFDAANPTFDRKGDFLYYRASNRFASPRYSDIDSAFIYAGTQQIMMVPLREDVKNPLGLRSDEESIKKDSAAKKPAEKRDEGEERDDKGEKKKGDEKIDAEGPGPDEDRKGDEKKPDAKNADHPPKKELRIDFDGFERRAVALPISSGNFGPMAVSDDGRLVYMRQGSRGEEDAGSKRGLKIFDPRAVGSGEKKDEETILEGVAGFDMSASGKKLLVRMSGGGAKYRIVDPVAGGGKAQDVVTTGMRLTVDPREEWKQIFQDAWRVQRDFFYVENMHGVDWAAMRTHYGAMIEDAASREDVQYILGELISELNIGHAYVQGAGDVGDQGPSVSVGMLGCDFELDSGAYRIKQVYTGAPWDADARGPLAGAVDASGRRVSVDAGTYVLAVNGIPMDTSQDPWAAFVGMADRAIAITVSDRPSLDSPGAKEVLVKPIGSDTALRYRAWIERNREYVERTSEGKVGYVHVPDTGVNGQNELFRQFYGQKGRAAMIIDERWNGGGQLPYHFIELLNRPATNAWALRDWQDWITPNDAHQGPKCMLVNGLAGSGGDMFPWLFKHDKIGPVIGQRTWGGLVGISGNPQFIDGGTMTVPRFGFYKLDGTWGVEGHGVDPDVVVVDDPALMLDGAGPDGPHASIAGGRGGGDPQLDEAIKMMVREAKEHPFVKPVRPPSPDRKGMGIPERDR